MKKLHVVRTVILTGSLLLQLSTHCLGSLAAPGDVDLSFDPGLGVNSTVNAVIAQPDGKVIIGGQFTTVRGFARRNLARLNTDGSGDVTFNPGQAFDIVDSLALQPDGQVLVGSQTIYTACYEDWGCESYYGSVLTRLNPDGTLNAGFSNATVNAGSPYGFTVLTLQPDGKILVGGYFNTVNGTDRNGIARLNADGTLDAGFNPGSGIGGHQPWVFSIAVQSNGQVLVGGIFDTFNGTNRNGLARLNSDGSLDPAFHPGTELQGDFSRAETVVIQPDGKVLAGGWFTNAMGSNLTRFNADGSLDRTFHPGASLTAIVFDATLQADGKILLVTGNRMARLNADGSPDASFDPGTEVSGAILDAVVQSNGQVLVGGTFTSVNGLKRNRVARLNANGSLEGGFDPGRGLEQAVSALALQADGMVLLGGPLVVGDTWWGPLGDVLPFVNGTNQSGRARLNANGKMDSAFVSAPFYPNLTAMYGDDCVGLPNYGCYQGAVTTAVLVEPDGKVLISGYVVSTITGDETFIQFNRPFLARFNASGSLESRFHQLDSASVNAMARQTDGRILIGGSLVLNGTNSTVARLNVDGSIDGSFQLGQGPVSVFCLALQSDGKVVVGGYNDMARLNADGTRDACFNPGLTPIGGVINAVAVQPDDKVLLGGSFSTVNGVGRNGIARLEADGRLDLGFNPGAGVNGTVSSLVVQPDGDVLIGGDFFSVNGVARPYVARLRGGDSGPQLRVFATTSNAVVFAWPSSSPGFTLQQNTDLASPNWVDVAAAPASVGLENHLAVAPTIGQRFFRLSGDATAGATSPVPAPVAPRLTAIGGDAQVALSWTAFALATGHRVQRATSYAGPYTTIAHPTTPSYTDTTVVNGTIYFYTVSVVYPCGESANSPAVGIVPLAPPPAVHVESITMSWVPPGSRYNARAVVKVVDNAGVAVSGATVVGDFSGSINNAGRTGVTTANGTATITSSSSIRHGTVTFTVVDIYTATLSYHPASNVVTSATITR